VSVDQGFINNANKAAMSFTVSQEAEVEQPDTGDVLHSVTAGRRRNSDRQR